MEPTIEQRIQELLIRKSLADMAIRTVKGLDDPRAESAEQIYIEQSKCIDAKIQALKAERGDVEPEPVVIAMKPAVMAGEGAGVNAIDKATAQSIQLLDVVRDLLGETIRGIPQTVENDEQIKSLQAKQRDINEEINRLKGV